MPDQWYYVLGGNQHGPVPFEELRALAVSGALGADDEVWREGTADWVPVKAVPELAAGDGPRRPPFRVRAGDGVPRGRLWARFACGAVFSLAALAVAVGLLVGFPWSEGVGRWLSGGLLLLVIAAVYAVLAFALCVPALRGLRPGGTLLLPGAATLLPLLGLAAAWGVIGAGLLAARAEQRRTVAEVRDLIAAEKPSRDAEPLARHGKALVWDVDANDCRAAQYRLPPGMRAAPGGGPLTIFAVTRVTKQDVGKYSTGETGYRQDATVSVVTWPDKTVLGTYVVKGETPGFIVFREKGESGPVLGDLDKPLADWVAALPDADSETHREALAQWRLAQEARDRFVGPDAVAAPAPAAVAQKLLVWDLATNRPGAAQRLLPAERQARSSDGSLTVVAVVETKDVPVTKYTDGRTGYRRDSIVALVSWPEKKVLGRQVVRGADPPLLQFGGMFEAPAEAVYGDHDKPLADWAAALPVAQPGG